MDRPRDSLAFDPPRQAARSLRGYRLSSLPRDVVGGALIVAIGIPISMGMAEVAGLPPIVGLYSCVLAPVAFALFGSSRQLVVALDASTAALLGAAITPLAAGDPDRQIALASLVAVLVGVLLIVGGLAHAGVIAALLSLPVLLGYQAALAVVVIASQLPKLLGLRVDADTTLGTLHAIVSDLRSVDGPTLLLGVACLVVIGVAAWRWPRMPGALIAIVLATLAVEVLAGSFSTVAVVGALPSGLPPLGLPDPPLGDIPVLLPATLAIALIASADTIVTSRAFGERGGYEVDASTDMRGVGVANAASGLSGGITIGASAARTAVVEMVGVRSQMAGVAAAVLMAATLMFLTTPLAHLPVAALGAVVIGAVLRLVDVAGFRALWRIDHLEWTVGAATATIAVVFGLLQGVVVGAALSLGVLAVRTRPLRIQTFRSATTSEERRGGAVVVHLAGPVVYLNATRMLDGLRRAASHARRTIIVDATRLGAVDASGALALTAFAAWVERNDVDVVLAGLSDRNDAVLRRAGFWSGPNTIDRTANVDEAIALRR